MGVYTKLVEWGADEDGNIFDQLIDAVVVVVADWLEILTDDRMDTGKLNKEGGTEEGNNENINQLSPPRCCRLMSKRTDGRTNCVSPLQVLQVVR